MNTQTKLSELDAMKLQNFLLRKQMLSGEEQAFGAQLFAAYGNEGEHMEIHPDGGIARTQAPATKATRPKKAR